MKQDLTLPDGTKENPTQAQTGLTDFFTNLVVQELKGVEEELKTALDSGNVTPEIIGAALAQHKNRNGL